MRQAPDAHTQEQEFLRLLGGKWITAAIGAAASLGIAEALAEGPRSIEQLAEKLACDRDALARLLRILQSQNLLATDAPHVYRLTSFGSHLRQERMGALARFVASPFAWEPWAQLANAVRTGKPAFELQHRTGLFDYLEEHPEAATIYHYAIDAFTRQEARALLQAVDFSAMTRIADVGGGSGTLLGEILQQQPHLHGVLIDLPAAAARARANLRKYEFSPERYSIHEGNFFEPLPTGMDTCILKHVIHNWDDGRATLILKQCSAAIQPDGRVLVVEGVRLPDPYTDITDLMDLEMLVLCSGHERTKPEMRKLLAGAELQLEHSQQLTATSRLFVCKRRP